MAMKVQGGRMVPMSPIKQAAYDIVSSGEDRKVIQFGNLLQTLKSEIAKNYPTAGTELQMLEIARSITGSSSMKNTLVQMVEDLMDRGEAMARAKADYSRKLADVQGKYGTLNEAIYLTKR